MDKMVFVYDCKGTEQSQQSNILTGRNNKHIYRKSQQMCKIRV